MTKWMYWLKTNIGKIEITELGAAAKLETCDKEQEGYLWQSFEPICASAEHAAIVHYEPTPETDVPLTQNGLFLTDTGGGYLEGSTVSAVLLLGRTHTADERRFHNCITV